MRTSTGPSDAWRRARREIGARPIAASVGFILVVSAAFLAFPQIDLWFSGLFYTAGEGFTLARIRSLSAFRRSGDVVVVLVVVWVIVQVGLKLARPERPSHVPPNAALFLLSTLAVGPGLVVNLILKGNWGRPRPLMIERFGGSEPYVEVWRITEHCLRNCSFVSGEAASAIWLTALALIVPKGLRLPVALVAGVYAVLLSLNRVAFGGHFLSDVLLAWGITLLLVFIGHRFMVERPPSWLGSDRLESGLTRLGLRLHGRTNRLTGS